MDKRPQQHRAKTPEEPRERPERPPTWTNTRPRENPELDRRDLDRSVERLEMVLGR
jgi:hypothetical protein